MSTRKAEAHHAGTVDGHNDAQAGRPMRESPATTKGRDGYTLLHDQADADAYWHGYTRSYQDEHEARYSTIPPGACRCGMPACRSGWPLNEIPAGRVP